MSQGVNKAFCHLKMEILIISCSGVWHGVPPSFEYVKNISCLNTPTIWSNLSLLHFNSRNLLGSPYCCTCPCIPSSIIFSVGLLSAHVLIIKTSSHLYHIDHEDISLMPVHGSVGLCQGFHGWSLGFCRHCGSTLGPWLSWYAPERYSCRMFSDMS